MTKLTPISKHLLVCLMEECAEIQKEAAKALRFGLYDEYQDTTPQTRLKTELNDLEAIRQLLILQEIDIGHDHIEVLNKMAKLDKMIEYSKDRGCFE